MKNLHVLF